MKKRGSLDILRMQCRLEDVLIHSHSNGALGLTLRSLFYPVFDVRRGDDSTHSSWNIHSILHSRQVYALYSAHKLVTDTLIT